MSLIQEIHKQHHGVRYALFGFSAVITLSFVGFVWFRSIQKDMFMAVHNDPAEQAEFLAKREESVPHPFAAIGKGLSSLTANIGSLLGFDGSEGFDSQSQDDTVYMLPLSE
jgi:hypothetical protein